MTEPNEGENASEAERLRMPEPVLTDLWNALGDTVYLRLALNTLESNLPAHLGH